MLPLVTGDAWKGLINFFVYGGNINFSFTSKIILKAIPTETIISIEKVNLGQKWASGNWEFKH